MSAALNNATTLLLDALTAARLDKRRARREVQRHLKNAVDAERSANYRAVEELNLISALKALDVAIPPERITDIEQQDGENDIPEPGGIRRFAAGVMEGVKNAA